MATYFPDKEVLQNDLIFWKSRQCTLSLVKLSI